MRWGILLKTILIGCPVLWLATAAYLSGGATHVPPSLRVPLDPANPPQAVLLTSDHLTLRAWTHLPTERPWNGRAALLLHGVSDSHRGMRGLAAMLTRRGYRVLTPDSRGHGASDGEVFSYGVLERKDVTAWVDWIEQNWHPEMITGLGASMGAAILLQASPTEPRLRAIVADCPFSTFRSVAYYRVGRVAGPFLLPAVEPALLLTRWNTGIDLALASPLEAMRSTNTPILLIHGEEDVNIPVEQSEELAAAGSGRKCQLWRVPKAAHVASYGASPEEYERRVTAWFDTAAASSNSSAKAPSRP